VHVSELLLPPQCPAEVWFRHPACDPSRSGACRELAVQLDEQVEALGRSCNVRHLLVVGGLDQFAQTTELRKRPHIVVATPGRLADILNTSTELQQGFRRTAVLVLDEADRVLEQCFEQPLRDIMKVLNPTCSSGR